MNIDSIWNNRFQQFYLKMVRYFSVIGMSVFYSILLGGAVFIYWYLKLLPMIPSSFYMDIFLSFFMSLLFLQTRVRTFAKRADLVFLRPMEGKLGSYFKKSMVYSGLLDAVKWGIVIIIINPLLKISFYIPLLFLFLCLIVLNIRLTWVMQWLHGAYEKLLHQLIRILSFSVILFLFLMDYYFFSFLILFIQFLLFPFIFGKRQRGINWSYLIEEEEKALAAIYKFIQFYIDVPHLKRSFRRRTVLSWIIKRVIKHRQSSTFNYLFSHLFTRYNEFYYLYIRLTLIGCTIIYFSPLHSWAVILFILFITGYQLLPLQLCINDIIQLYPISFEERRKSFLKIVRSLLFIQLLLLNLVNFIQTDFIEASLFIVLEIIFIYVLLHFFLAKKVQ
ncbi:ABC transporter permease [Metabacillus fastidiosus]|uniref:ABC transporter permease n=1 Tax=Metabacillus fastidiosus TaxID=1458 RepID=UPI002DBAC03D|nr:ABC transporter permease [Metabacillus fastidiosus]MEC2078060.1 ABC transporter permease [Metabacillus fastidiosus]